MATSQIGVGGLTIEGGAAGTLEQKAAVLVGALVSGTIVEDVNFDAGGSPTVSEQKTSSGAFHTDLIHENRQDTGSVVLVGKESGLVAGTQKGDYEITKASQKYGKAAVKTDVSVKKVANLGSIRT